ncbi:hypothetical protein PV327_004545 [Microctonus hyperodae]|uniref:Uncharacterized protein n=1 Tax=Microctonus hyperodae TaxID=165561 RepID=A0AA39FCM5_MICHY|nr:hypothetical protein PV327_004545 [Microctonus hyperodae]
MKDRQRRPTDYNIQTEGESESEQALWLKAARYCHNLQSLQPSGGMPPVNTPPSYSHNLQSSSPISSAYVVGIAKPIARPTAYHPHHPPHPSHQPTPTQHHFSAHAHHTLQLLACGGPYLTAFVGGGPGARTGQTPWSQRERFIALSERERVGTTPPYCANSPGKS